MSEIRVIKADGEKEFFSGDKLSESLRRSGAGDELVKGIVSHVERELINDISTSDIYRHAFSLLANAKKPIAARYSLRRALVGFGPTGFPFEEYVAEIFKAQGYQTLNDQIVKGGCVDHEVDVVAWNDNELVMSEVKFHNEQGLKSDLKVALYVKARVDDLKRNTFFYGDKQRKLDDALLITNTKFSEQAIKYGACMGLKMIGWNYPEKNNLQDLIEGFKLHPVSCLTSLNNSEKQSLFGKKIVLCKSLKDDPSILESLGLSEQKIREVKEEIENLVI